MIFELSRAAVVEYSDPTTHREKFKIINTIFLISIAHQETINTDFSVRKQHIYGLLYKHI